MHSGLPVSTTSYQPTPYDRLTDTHLRRWPPRLDERRHDDAVELLPLAVVQDGVLAEHQDAPFRARLQLPRVCRDIILPVGDRSAAVRTLQIASPRRCDVAMLCVTLPRCCISGNVLPTHLRAGLVASTGLSAALSRPQG